MAPSHVTWRPVDICPCIFDVVWEPTDPTQHVPGNCISVTSLFNCGLHGERNNFDAAFNECVIRNKILGAIITTANIDLTTDAGKQLLNSIKITFGLANALGYRTLTVTLPASLNTSPIQTAINAVPQTVAQTATQSVIIQASAV
jgi:hypothetical protein